MPDSISTKHLIQLLRDNPRAEIEAHAVVMGVRFTYTFQYDNLGNNLYVEYDNGSEDCQSLHWLMSFFPSTFWIVDNIVKGVRYAER